MGVTHTSILNGLYPGALTTYIVELNPVVRLITKRTLGYEISKSIEPKHFKDALVLITTPPGSHQELASIASEHGATSIFVEKPFGLYDKRVIANTKIKAGYVLRFTEVAQKLKEIIRTEGCRKISLEYNSFTLAKKPRGWRNGKYGGVLNEMGSHLIDLILHLTGKNEFSILKTSCKSVVTNQDDIVFTKGYIGEIEFDLSLNWVKKDCRKPVWSGKVTTERRDILFDQQSISTGFTPNQVDYYVRGREFSLQMKHFVQMDESVICSSVEANTVHDVIETIKGKQ